MTAVASLTGGSWAACCSTDEPSLSVAAVMELVSKPERSGMDSDGENTDSNGGCARNSGVEAPSVRLFGTLRFLLEDLHALSGARQPPPPAVRPDVSPTTEFFGVGSADASHAGNPPAAASSANVAAVTPSKNGFGRISAAGPALSPRRPDTVACSVDAAAHIRSTTAAAAVGTSRPPGPRFAIELLKLRDRKKLFEDAAGLLRRPRPADSAAAAVAAAALASAPLVVAFRLGGSCSTVSASRAAAMRGSHSMSKSTDSGRKGRLAGCGFGSLTASHRWPNEDGDALPRQAAAFTGVVVPSHTDCECPHCQLYTEERSIVASPSPPQRATPISDPLCCGGGSGGCCNVDGRSTATRSSNKNFCAEANQTGAVGDGLLDSDHRRHRRSRKKGGRLRRAADRTVAATNAGKLRPATMPELGRTSHREVVAPGGRHGYHGGAVSRFVDGAGNGGDISAAADETCRGCSAEDAEGRCSEQQVLLSPPALGRNADRASKTAAQPLPENRQLTDVRALSSADEDARLPPVSPGFAVGSLPERRHALGDDGVGSGGFRRGALRYDLLRLPEMSSGISDASSVTATTAVAIGKANFSKRSAGGGDGNAGGNDLTSLTAAGPGPMGSSSDATTSARPAYKLRYSKGGLLTSPLYGSLSTT